MLFSLKEKGQGLIEYSLILAVVAAVLLALGVTVYFVSPVSDDWNTYFRPATLAMLHGESPYIVPGYYNPFWTLIPMIPFALLPEPWGRIGFFLLSFLAFGVLLYRLKPKPMSMVLFFTCFPVIACLQYGEIDWLALLAFVTPAPLALILAATKPQIGLGIGVYWLIASWQAGGVKGVFKNFYPVTLLFILSFVLYDDWFLTSINTLNKPFNIALFPWLVPLGIYLLTTRKKNAALATGVCVSPYHTNVSLVSLFTAVLDYPALLGIAWTASWAYAWWR